MNQANVTHSALVGCILWTFDGQVSEINRREMLVGR
jgi:hypothetical protein